MSTRAPTILVIDPDQESYNTIESVLGIQNRVLFVPNGRTAFDLPQTQSIDLIFISQVLNGSQGITLLESFKKEYPSIPIIFFVENPTADAILSAFRSGAREVIKKPLDEKELLDTTHKIIRLIADHKTKRQKNRNKKRNNHLSETHVFQGNGGGLFKRIFQKFNHNGVKKSNDVGDFQNEPHTVIEEVKKQKLVSETTVDIERQKISLRIEEIKSLNELVQAFFFGNFRFRLKDQVIDNWPSKKGKSLFAYILFHHERRIYRDILMDTFWPKTNPDSARNSLNVALHSIRRVLQVVSPASEFIIFKDECYYLNPQVEIWSDVDDFRKIWRNAQNIELNKGLSSAVSEYERAAQIYRGEFLEDEIYDSWSALDRENLKEIYLVILDKISEFYVLSKKHSEAIGLCEKILEKDNCREDIYRRQMLAYYRIGQRDKAIKQFQKCVEVLKDELEVKPSSETINLFEQLKRDSLITKN